MDLGEVSKRSSRPTFGLEKELENQDSAARSSDDDSDYVGRRVSTTSSYPDRSPGSHFPNSDVSKDTTLGQYILDRVGGVVKGLFRNSKTILRVDLRQALRYDVPALQKNRALVRGRANKHPDARQQPAWRSDIEENEGDVQSRGWFHGLQGGGARLKLMQIWELKDPDTGEDRLPFNVNFGFGSNVAMDSGEAQPKLRIRAPFVAFHFFPEPYLELRGNWPLGNTNLAVRARYRIPVSSMRTLWESSSSRLMINLYHRSGTLFHLTPGGLEFEDQRIPFGQFGTMRIAASVDFPRQLPLEEGEQPFRLRIMRLGLKSRIM